DRQVATLGPGAEISECGRQPDHPGDRRTGCDCRAALRSVSMISPPPRGQWPPLFAMLLLVAGLAAGASVLGERWFEDITARAGIAHKHTNRQFKNRYANII